jgi:hypothetical protein
MYENETDLRIAERELAAFYTAVLKTHGPEEASTAARDWIEALETMGCAADGGPADWRSVTIAAASCLAARVTNAPAAA